MGLQTFLGPILAGTQKNNNTVFVTSNTPSATYLSPYGTGNSYRNTGAGDCFQFVSVPAATLTGIAAASFPSTVIPTYTVTNGNGTTNYPLVFPAGSYIDNIDFIVNTAITTSGSPSSLSVALQLIGAPGSTYATTQTIATATLPVTTNAVTTPIGIYSTANTGTTASQYVPLVYSGSATPLAMIQNTGPTDVLFQIALSFPDGTTPKITAGAFAFAFNYVVRNPDGSWYPQTPPNPFTTPIPAVY